MTEEEWLAATDPTPLLEFMRGKASDRKLRLIACACCRRVWNLLSNKHCRKALITAEAYADAKVSEEKLRFAWGDARRAAQQEYRREIAAAEATAMWSVGECCEANVIQMRLAVGSAARSEAYPTESLLLSGIQAKQAVLVCDIIGNPFRPLAVNPAWLTSDVIALGAGFTTTAPSTECRSSRMRSKMPTATTTTSSTTAATHTRCTFAAAGSWTCC